MRKLTCNVQRRSPNAKWGGTGMVGVPLDKFRRIWYFSKTLARAASYIFSLNAFSTRRTLDKVNNPCIMGTMQSRIAARLGGVSEVY